MPRLEPTDIKSSVEVDQTKDNVSLVKSGRMALQARDYKP
jgi:hypothetical protein